MKECLGWFVQLIGTGIKAAIAIAQDTAGKDIQDRTVWK
jgi:hypothetical protein